MSDQLENASLTDSKTAQGRLWLEEIGESIVNRAQGVFLWVSLAVKDQIRGYKNGDTYEQLGQRLEHLPSQVERIYVGMLKAIDPPYLEEAAKYLNIAIHHPRIPLIVMALMCHSQLDQMVEGLDEIAIAEVAASTNLTKERINTTCAGLLECREIPPSSRGYSVLSGSEQGPRLLGIEVECSINVEFVHRTAYDFIRRATQGGEILDVALPSTFDLRTSYAKVYIIQLHIFGLTCLDEDWNKRCLACIMKSVNAADNTTGIVHVRLYELTYRIICNIKAQYFGLQRQGPKLRNEIHHALGTSEHLEWDVRKLSWIRRLAKNGPFQFYNGSLRNLGSSKVANPGQSPGQRPGLWPRGHHQRLQLSSHSQQPKVVCSSCSKG